MNQRKKVWERCAIYFLFYGTLGWIFERIILFVLFKTFICSNFLHLPFLLYYGFASDLIFIIFKDDDHEIYNIALVGGCIFTLFQYVSSILLKLFFKIKDWKNLLPVEGRWLFSFIGYMMLSILMIKIINPRINRKIKKYHQSFFIKWVIPFLCIFVFLDFILVVIQSVLF